MEAKQQVDPLITHIEIPVCHPQAVGYIQRVLGEKAFEACDLNEQSVPPVLSVPVKSVDKLLKDLGTTRPADPEESHMRNMLDHDISTAYGIHAGMQIYRKVLQKAGDRFDAQSLMPSNKPYAPDLSS